MKLRLVCSFLSDTSNSRRRRRYATTSLLCPGSGPQSRVSLAQFVMAWRSAYQRARTCSSRYLRSRRRREKGGPESTPGMHASSRGVPRPVSVPGGVLCGVRWPLVVADLALCSGLFCGNPPFLWVRLARDQDAWWLTTTTTTPPAPCPLYPHQLPLPGEDGAGNPTTKTKTSSTGDRLPTKPKTNQVRGSRSRSKLRGTGSTELLGLGPSYPAQTSLLVLFNSSTAVSLPPPPKTSDFLFNEISWLLDTRKDTLLKKRPPYIFLCAKV